MKNLLTAIIMLALTMLIGGWVSIKNGEIKSGSLGAVEGTVTPSTGLPYTLPFILE